jgi:hypothetical protein
VAELHIKSLTCVDKQTGEDAKDRASLRVNGRTVSGPHIMGEGKSVTLNLRHQFANKVAVMLVEQDRDNADDIVGTVLVDDKVAGEGERIGHFNEAPHAKYKMTYVVRR